ncbi:Molybdopterin molybdenumtransferase [bacterium HR15]|nr:Molybdopterin molybdenumtransferase [bacterium HR15]
MISIEEALTKVLNGVAPLGVESIDLMECTGRVLAEPLYAPHDLPPFDNAAMDGYALRVEDTRQATPDTPVSLRIVGEAAAGRGYGAPLQPGEAVLINTGAPVPAHAAAVLPLEQAQVHDQWLIISEPVKPADHIRRKGLDVQAGMKLLEAGTRLQQPHIGLLAALGLTPLKVYRRPRVAIITTGNELLPYDAPLRPDSIRDSNSVMVLQWLRAWGIPCPFRSMAPDELPALTERIEQALSEAEVVLLTGGVSVGRHDLVQAALQQIGAEVVFWRVNIKPGKPLLFARHGNQAIFGLPGNPLAVVVGLYLFVRSYLAAQEGETVERSCFLRARLNTPIHKKESRAEFLTAYLRAEPDGTLSITPTPAQGSSLLGALAQANAFLYLPAGESDYPAGTLVRALPIAPMEGYR